MTLHMITSFLLFDGRQHEFPLQMMNEEGAFPRLLELLHVRTLDRDDNSGAGLHRLLMDLLYELSRVQKIKIEDLSEFPMVWWAVVMTRLLTCFLMTVLVDDDFVRGLFDIIENLSFDANDPYHYPVIRVLVCFLFLYIFFKKKKKY